MVTKEHNTITQPDGRIKYEPIEEYHFFVKTPQGYWTHSNTEMEYQEMGTHYKQSIGSRRFCWSNDPSERGSDDKELEKLRLHNTQLQMQLNEARNVIRTHEKRLLAFSNLLNHKTSNVYEHDLKPLNCTRNKRSTCNTINSSPITSDKRKTRKIHGHFYRIQMKIMNVIFGSRR